jgi:cholesterol transport system auxiliary component
MLRALHTETINGQTSVIIRFDAQLINTARRDIIASKRFEAREALNRNDATAAASALGIAADRLAAELIAWTAENHAD